MLVGVLVFPARLSAEVTFASLLDEMVDRTVVTHWPEPEYRSLQASSYGRMEDSGPGTPGWFANGDCDWHIRKETVDGRTECVLMEHNGPGVLTRLWTPDFQNKVNDRKVGTDIRIYIDGETTPRIQGSMIQLLTGQLMIKSPFASVTRRAGLLILPIPFKKSCKITREDNAFFYIINYRAYAPGTEVESFNPDMLNKEAARLERVGRELVKPTAFSGGQTLSLDKAIAAGKSERLELPAGAAAVRQFEIKLEAANLPIALRSTVMEIIFDGEQSVWCPVGDFFSNVNGLDPAHTMWERDTLPDGRMICRWIMPYQRTATIILHNLAKETVTVKLQATTSPWQWTKDSLYFRTAWWTHDPYPARPVFDMNFIDVQGRGIHVGDTLVVLQPEWSWWGEGDEKIWVDGDFDRKLPSHLGTGSEDYYGWAGGVVPTRKDEFSAPFASNVRVGGMPYKAKNNRMIFNTTGYNICSRSRSLDATPFARRFKFDMEAFNMCGGPNDWLQYSLVTHWYGAPGATHNRPPMPEAAAIPVPQVEDVVRFREATGVKSYAFEGAVEMEDLVERDLSAGVTAKRMGTPVDAVPRFSNDALLVVNAAKPGDSATFTFTERYRNQRMVLHLAKNERGALIKVSVNGQTVPGLEQVEGYAGKLEAAKPIDLGVVKPDGNVIRLKVEVVGKAPLSKGYDMLLDAVTLTDDVDKVR